MLKNGEMRRQADRLIFPPRAVPLQAAESKAFDICIYSAPKLIDFFETGLWLILGGHCLLAKLNFLASSYGIKSILVDV